MKVTWLTPVQKALSKMTPPWQVTWLLCHEQTQSAVIGPTQVTWPATETTVSVRRRSLFPLTLPNSFTVVLQIAYDFLSLFYCFIVLLCVCVVPGPTWYIAYFYGTIQSICAESAVKYQQTKPNHFLGPEPALAVISTLNQTCLTVCSDVCNSLTPDGWKAELRLVHSSHYLEWYCDVSVTSLALYTQPVVCQLWC